MQTNKKSQNNIEVEDYWEIKLSIQSDEGTIRLPKDYLRNTAIAS